MHVVVSTKCGLNDYVILCKLSFKVNYFSIRVLNLSGVMNPSENVMNVMGLL